MSREEILGATSILMEMVRSLFVVHRHFDQHSHPISSPSCFSSVFFEFLLLIGFVWFPCYVCFRYRFLPSFLELFVFYVCFLLYLFVLTHIFYGVFFFVRLQCIVYCRRFLFNLVYIVVLCVLPSSCSSSSYVFCLFLR